MLEAGPSEVCARAGSTDVAGVTHLLMWLVTQLPCQPCTEGSASSRRHFCVTHISTKSQGSRLPSSRAPPRRTVLKAVTADARPCCRAPALWAEHVLEGHKAPARLNAISGCVRLAVLRQRAAPLCWRAACSGSKFGRRWSQHEATSRKTE